MWGSSRAGDAAETHVVGQAYPLRGTVARCALPSPTQPYAGDGLSYARPAMTTASLPHLLGDSDIAALLARTKRIAVLGIKTPEHRG